MFDKLFGRTGLIFGLAISMATGLLAQDKPTEPARPKSFVDALRANEVKLIDGPATVKLGDVAEIALPAGYHAVDRGSLKRFYEFTQNSMGGDAVGVVIAPSDWMLFFNYNETGYIKDDEKDSLNAGKLMKTMTANQDAANEERVKRGWDEMKVVGWASEPHYDEKTHNLKWAIKLTSSSDNHQTQWINESIRLLGRGGVMKVTLVTDNDAFAADSIAAGSLLSQKFNYIAGQRYADFKQGDKIAEYGLGALVLGGAGAAAFKFGFFQKFWKLIVAGGAAVAGAIGKLWNKITGKDAA